MLQGCKQIPKDPLLQAEVGTKPTIGLHKQELHHTTLLGTVCVSFHSCIQQEGYYQVLDTNWDAKVARMFKWVRCGPRTKSLTDQ